MSDNQQPESANTLNLFTPYLREVPVWKEFMETVDALLDSNVVSPIRELEKLRFLTADSEQTVLMETCRLLGFDLSQDILASNVNPFTRIATQLAMYSDYNGTQQFKQFLSLILGGYCEVTYLFSDDYEDFYAEPGGKLITEGGVWFQTTHVELDVGLSTLAGINLPPGQSLAQRVKIIFYDQAPITLVIERLNFVVIDRVTIGVAAKFDGGYGVAFEDDYSWENPVIP